MHHLFPSHLHYFHTLFHDVPWISLPWLGNLARPTHRRSVFDTASLLQHLAVHGIAQQGLVEGVDLLGEVGVLHGKNFITGTPESVQLP